MVRRWWKPLYLGWLCITLPIFVVLYVLLHDHPLIAIFIFWWLKPLYERLPLLIVSQALFGTVPRVRDALREYFHLLSHQLLQTLTFRRLVPTRSFDQPVAQLENLAGGERQRRLELMRRTAGSPAFWLTFVSVHVEMFLTLGLVTLVYQLIPSEVEVDWWGLIVSADSGALDWLSNFLYFLAISLVGPIYAVGGFSLYINRRIELEGWDIELEFRRLMSRVRPGGARYASVLVCLIVAGAMPSELPASEESSERSASRALIEEVMRGPEFNEESITKVPKALQDWFEEEDEQAASTSSPEWVVTMLRMIARSIEFLLWVVVISGVIWIVYRYRSWIMQFLERKAPALHRPGDRPSVMFGLDVSHQSLPANPIVAAESLWSQRRYREAVSVLYRAALIALMDRHQCRLRASDTENLCVEIAQREAPADTAERFRRLTALWQTVAYAHTVPSDDSFTDVCKSWSSDLRAEP